MSQGAVASEGRDRAPLIRHLALCVATIAAFCLRGNLRIGNPVLLIVAIATLVNLLASYLSTRPRFDALGGWVSPIFGVAGWIALMSLTGGVHSPFIAGLWMEVVLSAIGTVSIRRTILVTAGGITGLWLQQIHIGFQDFLLTPVLHTGFIALLSGVTIYISTRWSATVDDLSTTQMALYSRLEALEKEIDQARTVGSGGAGAARLGHALKNAVHSMRGFVGLIEPKLAECAGGAVALLGLRSAIDGLEDLSRATLGPGGPRRLAAGAEQPSARNVINDVVREFTAAFPETRWSCTISDVPLPDSVSPPLLREVLTILARNAVEVMQGKGEVQIEAVPRGRGLDIRVRDDGPGVPHRDWERIFEAGYTTKHDGHGLGLFLARRLLDQCGARIRLASAEGGALFAIELPSSAPPATP